MSTANTLARYEFSERLADILGESRRDLRFRVTLLVSSGLVAAGPRGRGSPPATPEYAARLLIGTMAAPQQSQTVEAIGCYFGLVPVVLGQHAPRVLFGPPAPVADSSGAGGLLLRLEGLSFGDALAGLLELACAEETRPLLSAELFGVSIQRGCPVAALQFATSWQGRRAVVSHVYSLAPEAAPPAWLDPLRGGAPDPGLFHTVFLPGRKLLEIGRLTTSSDDRRSLMLNKLGHRVVDIAKMAKRAAGTPHGSRWEKLLSTLAAVGAWSDQVDKQEQRLLEITDFGANPGELRMFAYLPRYLPPNAPLVVVLHGCTQSATSYDKGSGWSTLADRHGFALLFPQQQMKNNPLRCFNWFRPEDMERGRGEPESIRQMVEAMAERHAIDRQRVFVTGTSSGGAMTNVLLATYPDVFAGGAVIAGVPYRSASGMQEGLESIFQGRCRSAGEWAGLVRAASAHSGPWPRVSVWHGDADTAVKPVNAEETIKQWSHVHGLDVRPTLEMTVGGYPRRVWHGADGEELIESYTITGMSHGAALDPGPEPHQCGTAAPFFNAVGISSTHRIADFWGLLGGQDATADTRAGRDAAAGVGSNGETHIASASAVGDEQRQPGPGECDSRDAGATAGDRSRSDSRSAAGSGRAFGLDVHGIISASLEAAGLLKSGTARRSESRAPLGIDIPGIISTALEAAGALKELSQRAAPPGPPATLMAAGWEGLGWQLLRNDPRAFRGGAMMYGYVSSGENGALGARAHAVSRKVTLGARPELSYVRRLDLCAAVNDYTSASFRILVNGVIVDEVTAIGMLHQETEWLRQSAVDLSPFANQTVTLTLEVAAYANTCSTVFAKVWIDQMTIEEAVDAVA